MPECQTMATPGLESMDSRDTNESLKRAILLGDILQYSFVYPWIYLQPINATRAESLSKRFQDYGFIAVDVDLSQLTVPSRYLDSLRRACADWQQNIHGQCQEPKDSLPLAVLHRGLASSNAVKNRNITFDPYDVNSDALTAETQKDAGNVDDDALKAMCSISYKNASLPKRTCSGVRSSNFSSGMAPSSQAKAGADADSIAKPGKSGGKITLVVDSIDPKMLRSS